MEALLADRLPDGAGWQYEPKWDGFRCIAVREGAKVEMWSKSGKSLDRYFPEVAAMLGRLKAKRFTIDGELVIQLGAIVLRGASGCGFIPPKSASAGWPAKRRRSSSPSTCWRWARPRSPASRSQAAAALEKMLAKENEPTLHPVAETGRSRRGGSPGSSAAAERSTASSPSGSTIHTNPGERAMVKVKVRRTADCVVGGFRYDRAGAEIGIAAAWALRRCRPAQPRRLHLVDRRDPTAPPGRASLKRLSNRPASPARRQAARAAGRPSEPRNGSRSSRKSSSKCNMTRSPAIASATARGCSAAAPTRRQGNAAWTSSATRLRPRRSSNC